MRHRLHLPLAVVTSVLLVAAVAPVLAGAGPSSVSVSKAAGSSRTVTFHGYRIDVPAEWPVIRLATRSKACVRFDRPAVYLGHPGSQQACPAHLIGGAPGLLVEPMDHSVAVRAISAAERTVPGTARPAGRVTMRDGSLALPVEAAGVLVTAVYGTETAGVVRRALDGARITSEARPTALRSLAAPAARSDARARTVVAPGAFTGKGFDACTAPSQTAMNAWRGSSPYRSVGVYIGGISRACSQPNLTPSWVSTQVDKGWHLIPTYVGRQAPCTNYSNRVSADPKTARAQGRQEAGDAIAKATALGMRAPSAIYSDMEGYDSSNTTCRTAVLSYLSGWTARLHKHGYTSGVYSSVSSGIRDLAATYRSAAYIRPDHVWMAWWNDRANTDGGTYLADSLWSHRQRIHQYAGNVTESWGGYQINIDRNFLDVGGRRTKSSPRCPADVTFASYPHLRSGSQGRHVRAAECRLIARGYDGIRAGGSYGSVTERSVNRFESSLGFDPDGVLGFHTWTALLSSGSTPVLRRGSQGRAVRRVQRSLTAALGRTVIVDGTFQGGTAKAVRAYQRTRDIRVTGVVRQTTWRALKHGR